MIEIYHINDFQVQMELFHLSYHEYGKLDTTMNRNNRTYFNILDLGGIVIWVTTANQTATRE